MRSWRLALALCIAASPAGAAGRVVPIGVTARLTPFTGYATAAPGLTSAGALSVSAPALTPGLTALAAPPALPASVLAAPAHAPLVPGGPVAGPDALPAAAAARPLVFHSLKEFASHVLAGRGGVAADRVYSGAASREAEPTVDASGVRPSIPVGVREVEVHSVRSAQDVSRWIARGSNSNALIEGLRLSLGRMLPFDIYVYRDAVGGSFAAVDLTKNPANADRHPELAPHEAALIKKIQLWTKDLQVLVREEGKTPDLVAGGVVTELKSAHKQGDLATTISAANEQVWKHAQRHGLGLGAIAVDLVGRDSVPAGLVLAKLNAFAGKARDVGFSRAYFFAGMELMMFSLTKHGDFKLDESPRPFAARFPVAPARARDVHRVQLLTKAGKLEGARAQLAQLETHAEKDPRIAEAREQLETERVKRKISKLVSHGRDREAHAVWDRFRASRAPPPPR